MKAALLLCCAAAAAVTVSAVSPLSSSSSASSSSSSSFPSFSAPLFPTFDHHDDPPAGPTADGGLALRQLDAMTQVHIALMLFTYLFLLPIGLILAKHHSRWHPLVQLLILISTVLGVAIQAANTSKPFHTAHGKLGLLVTAILSVQSILGLIRWVAGLRCMSVHNMHRYLSTLLLFVLMPVQLYSGVDRATGMCGEVAGGLNNCIGHSLIPYAFVLAGVGLYLPVANLSPSQPLPTLKAWPFHARIPFEVAESLFIMVPGFGYFIGCLATEYHSSQPGGFYSRGFEHLLLSSSWMLFGFVGLVMYRTRQPYVKHGFPLVLACVVHALGFFAHTQHSLFSILTHWTSGLFTLAISFFRFRRQYREIFFCCIFAAAFLACSTSGAINIVTTALPDLPAVAWLMSIFGVVVGFLAFLSLVESIMEGGGASIILMGAEGQYSVLAPSKRAPADFDTEVGPSNSSYPTGRSPTEHAENDHTDDEATLDLELAVMSDRSITTTTVATAATNGSPGGVRERVGASADRV